MGTMHPAQEQLVAMTREMIERATAGDWEAVAREEAERRRLLAAGALDGARAGLLRELLALNEQLVSRVGAARDEAARARAALQTGIRAVSAYGENCR